MGNAALTRLTARRRHDWPERLSALVAGAAKKPFAWGSWDCCLFACADIEALTGQDPAAAYRGTYTDAAGGMALLQSLGGVEGLCQSVLGDQLKGPKGPAPLLAQRGDVAIFDPNAIGIDPAGLELEDADLPKALGVVLVRKVALLTPAGMRFVPLRACAAAWRV
jgi:hypothetical protein